jgi:anti-anti-sigma regulatory factor
MTLRIERVSDGGTTTIRLIGRLQAEHLDALKVQITESGSGVVLDLEELSLVDVDVVRFLGTCQASGIKIVHPSPYISDWIAKERTRKK